MYFLFFKNYSNYDNSAINLVINSKKLKKKIKSDETS